MNNCCVYGPSSGSIIPVGGRSKTLGGSFCRSFDEGEGKETLVINIDNDLITTIYVRLIVDNDSSSYRRIYIPRIQGNTDKKPGSKTGRAQH